MALIRPTLLENRHQGLQLRVLGGGLSQLLHFLVTDRQGFDNGVNMDVEVVGEAVLRFSRDIFQGQRVGNRDALSWNVYGPEVVFLGLEKHVLEPG